MALSAAAVAPLGFTTRYSDLLGLSLAAGAVTQVYRPAAATLLAELTPSSRLVITTAASRLGLNVGSTVAPLIGVLLAAHSYRAVFLADAASSLAFTALALRALPELAIGADHEHQQVGAPGTRRDRERSGYLALFADRRYLVVVAAMFAMAFADVQYQATLPLEVQHRGLPTAVYGAIVALNGVVVITFELPLTPLIQRLSMRTAVAVGTLLIGGGMALFGLPGGEPVFFLGAVVWTVGEIVFTPSAWAYPALAGPRRLRGRYIGALTASHSLGYAFGPSVGTLLFQRDPSLVWLMCAALGATGALGMWAGVRPLPSTHDSDPREPQAPANPNPASDESAHEIDAVS
jgi:predicted MFS family arabinose efflux permease